MHGQTQLFDDAAAPVEEDALPRPKASKRVPSRAIGTAPTASQHIILASTLPPRLYMGTSSWSYAGWNGLVYDGDYRETALAREGLYAYAGHPLLRCVGIDRTFYAPIGEADYRRYASQVNESFRFVVKAPMAITSSYIRDDAGQFSDSPFYFDPVYCATEFVEPCLAGLGQKAGPLVFQFPPQGRAVTREPDIFINRLYRFLKALPPYDAYAVEIRDPELLTPRFFTCLKTVGALFCVASHARMPAPQVQITLARTHMGIGGLVVRWSLHSGFKYEDAKSRYFPFDRLVDEDPDARLAIAAACIDTIRAGFPAYVVINNKAEGSAPLSVEKLATRIAAHFSADASSSA